MTTGSTIKGIVEVFSDKVISGWVVTDKPDQIELHVDSNLITKTWAARESGRAGGAMEFRLNLKDIWNYVAEGSRIEILYAGSPLAIAGHGTHYTCLKGGAATLKQLQNKLAKNYVFNQFGKLQLSALHNPVWQNAVMQLFTKLSETMRTHFSIEPFAYYGSLLGAVRNNTFIGHDHDFDAAYVVPLSDPLEVGAYATKVALRLIELGYVVKAKNTTINVSHPTIADAFVDFFHLYFDSQDNLKSPFGWAGNSNVKKTDFGGVTKGKLGSFEVPVPIPGDAIVEYLYGSDWRTPNPGFDWKKDRKKHCLISRFTTAQKNEVYWDNYYAVDKETSPSSFQTYVVNSKHATGRVIEFGCGDGRDSIAFARNGASVIGFDLSSKAVARATSRAAREKLDAEFFAADVSKTLDLVSRVEPFRLSHRGEILFYSRFFLHSLEEATGNKFLENVAGLMEQGDAFALEFRTPQDESVAKVHGNHFRIFRAPKAIQSILAKLGMKTILYQEGNGFAPYKDEDPYLCRIVAVKH